MVGNKKFILSPQHKTESKSNQTSLYNPNTYKDWQEGTDNRNYPVVAEIPISGGQLHSIAAGNYCLLGQRGEPFAVRFMLKSSFKLNNKNFVVRNIVMQIVAVGKDNVMRREDMATDVKIIKTKAKVSTKPVKEEMQFKVNDDKKELF